MLIPILISLKNYIKKDNNIKQISIIVSLITILLLITIFLFLPIIDININELEMPAVYAIDKICHSFKKFYGLIILISIFTTAISLGVSFLKNVSKNAKIYNKTAIIICITSIIFSPIGFSNLINLLYPILGGLGVFQIIQIFLNKTYCKNK